MINLEYKTDSEEMQESFSINEQIEAAEYDVSKYANYEDTSFVPDSYALLSKDLKRKYKILSKEEQDKIVREIKSGDESRKDELLCSNMALVISRAKKYLPLVSPIWEMNDLIQEGFLGLEKALELYDIDKDDKSNFTTYALYWIDCKIMRFIKTNNNSIRIPEYLMTKHNKVNRLISKGYSFEEAFALAEISEKDYYAVKDLITTTSLNKIILNDEDGNTEMGEFIKDESIPIDFGCVDADTMEQIIKVLKDRLRPKEFDVLVRRMGINGVPVETLESISDSLNITRERVRQIQNKALSKVKVGIRKIYA